MGLFFAGLLTADIARQDELDQREATESTLEDK